MRKGVFVINLSLTTLIGLITAICTTVSFVPQIVKILQTKRTDDVSLSMYAVFCTGIFLWIVYGFLIMDIPLLLANTISFILAMSVLILKIRHG